MLTVGHILKKARDHKKATIAEVAEFTRIRPEYLEKLEKDEFTGFVSATFIKGFIRSYANFLDLDAENLVAMYRRQVGEEEKPIKNVTKKVKTDGFAITPMHIISVSVIVFFVGVIALLVHQFYQLQQPPRLEIVSPEQQASETDRTSYEIKGFTEEDVTVTFNGSQIQLKPDRTFSLITELKPGENILTFEAWKQYSEDKKTKKTYVVKLATGQAQSGQQVAGATVTTTTAPSESNFTVQATDQAWIQVVSDNVQQAVGIVPANYKKEFKTKNEFYVTTGKPRQTKVTLNGEVKEWTLKNGVGSISCTIENGSWVCK